MKYYKVVNGIFEGFYSEDVQGDIVYGNEFHPISDERWMELLNGQADGKEIRILKDGTLGLYTLPVNKVKMLNPEFNYETEEWEELATYEELLEYYEAKLVEVQKDIKLREELGLRPSKEQLSLKEELMSNHMNVCHEIAITLN